MAESDKVLLRRYHENGDLQAREQLIEQYMSLVRSLARRYSYRGEQLDDLVQIGSIGLIKAIDRFDLERGVELTTYATPNIIGEIKRHFRDRGWAVRVPRGLQELNVQLSKIVEQLTVQLGRSPTIPELAKAAGVEEEAVLEALESGRAYSSLSLSSGGGTEDGEELDPLESLGEIEHEYEVSEDRAVLAPGFKVLDERERTILHLRFFEGLTQSQIAQQVGISQMHVSRLIRRALEKIRDEINAEGVARPEPRGVIQPFDRSARRRDLATRVGRCGWSISATRRSRSTNGASPSAPTVLFWHALGLDASGRTIEAVAPRIASAGFHVVALDGPGFGDSPLLPSERYRLEALAQLAHRLVATLDLEPLVFMGHSWGGAVAVRYAAAHPSLVRAVVLLDSGHIDYRDLPDVDADRAPEEWVAEAAARDPRLAEARGKAMHGLTDRVSVAWPVLAEHEIPTLLLLATVDPHGTQNRAARRRLRAGAAAGGGALGRGRGPRAARRRRAAARRRDRGLAAQPGRVGGPPDRCQAPVRELCQERDESSTDGVGALDARHASGCGCVRADGLVPWMRHPSETRLVRYDAVAGDGAGCPPRRGSPLPAKPPRLHCRPCP